MKKTVSIVFLIIGFLTTSAAEIDMQMNTMKTRSTITAKLLMPDTNHLHYISISVMLTSRFRRCLPLYFIMKKR
jgi:hypothetical protein